MIHEVIPIRVKKSEFEGRLITYIHESSIEISDYKRPMVVVCPGGGYSGTSDREAEPIALQYVAMGYHAAVLRYSTAPARFPEALRQLAAALHCCGKGRSRGASTRRKSLSRAFRPVGIWWPVWACSGSSPLPGRELRIQPGWFGQMA